MTSEDVFKRLRNLAYRVAELCEELPPGNRTRVFSYQILKSSFSAAANYRAACKGQSHSAFKSKLSIAFEEADETHFWLECICDLKMISNTRMTEVIKEADELARILGKSRKTAENREK
jgi:four helix bundle protein